jgi:hypothetical protein
MKAFRAGDRVQHREQTGITGVVTRAEGPTVWLLDDSRDDWMDWGDDGVLVYPADQLQPYTK